MPDAQKGRTQTAPAVVSRAVRRDVHHRRHVSVSARPWRRTTRATSSPSTATTTTSATPNLLVCNVNEAARERRAHWCTSRHHPPRQCDPRHTPRATLRDNPASTAQAGLHGFENAEIDLKGTGTMAIHSSEARRMRRELDKLLAAVADEADDELTWDAADLELIDLLMAAIDRKVRLSADYATASDDLKLSLKLSAELRLTETLSPGCCGRSPVAPAPRRSAPTSTQSGKARKAAQSRRARHANAYLNGRGQAEAVQAARTGARRLPVAGRQGAPGRRRH